MIKIDFYKIGISLLKKELILLSILIGFILGMLYCDISSGRLDPLKYPIKTFGKQQTIEVNGVVVGIRGYYPAFDEFKINVMYGEFDHVNKFTISEEEPNPEIGTKVKANIKIYGLLGFYRMEPGSCVVEQEGV